MGRPASGLDEYLDWQERLESYKASGLSVDEFCLRQPAGNSLPGFGMDHETPFREQF